MKEPIAITGFSSLSAVGFIDEDIWNNLTSGKRTLSSATSLDKNCLFYPFFSAPCFINNSTKKIPSSFYVPRNKSAKDTLFLAQFSAKEACLRAQIDEKTLQEARSVGIVMGTTAGSALHFIESYKQAKENNLSSHVSELDVLRLHNSDAEEYFHANLALEIAQSFQVTGPCLTIANACTSGTDAIGIGMELIRSKECDYVICGGADALSLVPHTGFARLMVYDEKPCMPFDGARKGLNLGEASAVLILESIEHAKRRNARILGFVSGYGSATDAHHFTAPHPEARGLQSAVEIALSDSGITQDALAFINAHATATKENDAIEGRFFHRHFSKIPIWASKGVTGHTLGAAGALEAIFSLLALQKQCVPLSLGFQEVDPSIQIIPTLENTAIQKKYALSTSLGFGGGNAALVISTDFTKE